MSPFLSRQGCGLGEAAGLGESAKAMVETRTAIRQRTFIGSSLRSFENSILPYLRVDDNAGVEGLERSEVSKEQVTVHPVAVVLAEGDQVRGVQLHVRVQVEREDVVDLQLLLPPTNGTGRKELQVVLPERGPLGGPLLAMCFGCIFPDRLHISILP